ncbi:MAG: alpha/beta hydrolase [Alphaproteobacteria bacterium]|nr:alpha/beta hydrolase [Alphaproteobacteria bacterium]
MAERTERASPGKPTARQRPKKTRAARRLGPRPLPLHLSVAMTTWFSSSVALPFLKAGWRLWRPELGEAGAALQKSLRSVDADSFRRAVTRELTRRFDDFLAGVQAYRRHPYRRPAIEPPAVWQDGTTSLLDYGQGAADGVPILAVPSLVNRSYILDLRAELSLMRHLAGAGFRPFLVDWDRPGPVERTFTLTDYIAGRLESALDQVIELTGRRPILLGYCMGGLLALALAQRRPRDVAGLALLATPWDFHADPSGTLDAMPAVAHACSLAIEAAGELPVDLIQTLFAALDPYLALRKFRSFARFEASSPRAELFVALEDWLNDGVALPAAVARECLFGWYGANTPAEGQWRVAGRAIDPGRLQCPAFVVVPARDRIVPPASAEILAARLPHATVLRPPLGHIGMIVSAGAEREAWRPLVEWLKSVIPGPPRHERGLRPPTGRRAAPAGKARS